MWHLTEYPLRIWLFIVLLLLLLLLIVIDCGRVLGRMKSEKLCYRWRRSQWLHLTSPRVCNVLKQTLPAVCRHWLATKTSAHWSRNTAYVNVATLIRCHPSSTIRILLITNHQPLFHMCITSPVESTPFFIPSTSLCLLSSWFTSSSAYHLITVTTFTLTICHSLGLFLQT